MHETTTTAPDNGVIDDVDLTVRTRCGRAPARVAFPAPLVESSVLCAATVALTHQARAAGRY